LAGGGPFFCGSGNNLIKINEKPFKKYYKEIMETVYYKDECGILFKNFILNNFEASMYEDMCYYFI
jgi:hypothetical protein